MQVLAVGGIVAAVAALCVAMYFVGRPRQRNGHDPAFVDPRFPNSVRAVGTAHP